MEASFKKNLVQPEYLCSEYLCSLTNSPAVEGFYVEINGIKQILVSLEAEIFADQHIQNPLKSASGEKLLALFAFLS